MTESNQPAGLAAAMRPPGSGAHLLAQRIGGLVRLEPLTLRATAWLQRLASAETSWDGPALVIEPRYFPDIADAAIAAGLSFERDALPN